MKRKWKLVWNQMHILSALLKYFCIGTGIRLHIAVLKLRYVVTTLWNRWFLNFNLFILHEVIMLPYDFHRWLGITLYDLPGPIVIKTSMDMVYDYIAIQPNVIPYPPPYSHYYDTGETVVTQLKFIPRILWILHKSFIIIKCLQARQCML